MRPVRGTRDSPCLKTPARLSCAQRRQAIIAAVKKVFAEKGFDGTTTRELADAAGVSEALLYKHFPSKDSLYAAMRDACIEGPGLAELQRALSMRPSTATLVVLVRSFLSRVILGWRADRDDERIINRLMLRSYLEDGAFARLVLRGFSSRWLPKFEECLNAAAAAGDLEAGASRRDLRGWFVRHLGVMTALDLIPAEPVVDYRASRRELADEAARFALRGIGLTERAMARHCRQRGGAAA